MHRTLFVSATSLLIMLWLIACTNTPVADAPADESVSATSAQTETASTVIPEEEPEEGSPEGTSQEESAQTTGTEGQSDAFVSDQAEPVPFDITLPPGFQIHLYATGISNARSMTLSPEGTLFVGTRRAGNLYAVRDLNQDYVADEVITLARGLNMPNGVAVRDGALYVGEVDRVLRYDNIAANLVALPEPAIINDGFPSDTWHGWKYIAFGPDDKLYVPVGGPCNVCEVEGSIYGTIMRMNADGSELEIYVEGVRNSVGFDWDPLTGDLWFTDNGRDNLGDDVPPDELNHVEAQGQHFGFPYCHAGTISDPEIRHNRSCDEFTPPAQPLGPHVAALGMRFYTGEQFPMEYQNQIFIPEHGSWNRSEPIGYRITLARLDEDREVISYETFAEGWLAEGGNVRGRPVALLIMPDGSMLVSDDAEGVIYRIVYTG